MSTLINRSFCLKHPTTIIRLFGLGVFLNILFSKRGLLEHLTEHYAAHGYPLPGKIGDAYRLSSLLEYRMSRIYAGFAEKFQAIPEAHALFDELRQEEQEHGRLMELCRYTVRTQPNLKYVPSVRDPAIHAMLQELRQIERRIPEISLSEALEITERLEQGELNTIFERLLKQADQSESRLFEDQMKQLEGHGTAVPKRIQVLRQNPSIAAS